MVLDQPGEAFDCYDHVLATNPDDVEALRGIAMALVSLGRAAEAVRYYERLQRLRR